MIVGFAGEIRIMSILYRDAQEVITGCVIFYGDFFFFCYPGTMKASPVCFVAGLLFLYLVLPLEFLTLLAISEANNHPLGKDSEILNCPWQGAWN